MKTWMLQNTEDPDLFGLGSMDIIYDKGGRLAELEGQEKLRFLALKCVLTGRYIEDGRSYGSTIPRLIGQKARQSNQLMEGVYLMAVDRALNSFRIAQPTGLDDDERMVGIEGEISVARDPRDRTVLMVGAAVKSAAGANIPVVHSFKTV